MKRTSEVFSPQWIEEKLNQIFFDFTEKWSSHLSQNGSKLLSIFLLNMGAGLLFLGLQAKTPDAPQVIKILEFASRIFYRAPIVLGLIMLASSLYLIRPVLQKASEKWVWTLIIFGFVFQKHDLFISNFLGFVLSFGFPFGALCIYLLRPNHWTYILNFISLPAWCGIALYLNTSDLMKGPNYLLNQPRFFMLTWLYLFESRSSAVQITPFSYEFWRYFLSPAQLLTNINILSSKFKKSELHSQNIQQRLFGLALLLQCILLLVLLFYLQKWMDRDQHHVQSIRDYLQFGVFNYFKYYALSFISLSTAEAGFRLLGYTLPASFRFPLLATTPHERWQRWSVPFYEFLKYFSFIPLIKKTGLAWLAVFATFWLSFFVHEIAYLLRWTQEVSSSEVMSLTLQKFLFFNLHAIVVLVSLKTHRYWPQSNSKYSWIGVLLTFFLMVLIHGMAP